LWSEKLCCIKVKDNYFQRWNLHVICTCLIDFTVLITSVPKINIATTQIEHYLTLKMRQLWYVYGATFYEVNRVYYYLWQTCMHHLMWYMGVHILLCGICSVYFVQTVCKIYQTVWLCCIVGTHKICAMPTI